MRYHNGMYSCIRNIAHPTKFYDCKHILHIDLFPENITQKDMWKYVKDGTEEWQNCVEKLKFENKDNPWSDRSITLKQEVIDWLNENVADSTDKQRADMPQGWMIYDPMVVHETTSLSVFFLRKVDAMAFKLRWT